MRIVRILVVAVAALIGIGLLYLSDRLQAPSFLQGVGNDVFGAAITALATWALFWPTKRLELARSLRRNHLELLTLAIAPKQLSWQVVEIFIERTNFLSNELPEAAKSNAKTYVESLEGFRNLYDQKDPSRDPKNNALTYRDKWNSTYEPFVALLSKLHGRIAREARKNPYNYQLKAGQFTPPTIPISAAKPLQGGITNDY